MSRPLPAPSRALLSALVAGALAMAAAAPAAAPVPGVPDAPITVTVQPGDTAYAVARRAGLTVDALLALNGLSSPTLRVGQTLRVRDVTVHAVQPGETLYALARRYGVGVGALLAENALPADATLKVGQILRVPGPGRAPAPGAAPAPTAVPTPAPPTAPGTAAVPVAPAPAPSAWPAGGVLGSPFVPALPAPDRPVLSPPSRLPGVTTPAALLPPLAPVEPLVGGPTDWRAAALSFLGTPYVYGGASRTGTDCSGLVVQVFAPLGVPVPRTSAQQALSGTPVPDGQWVPGDLVFFDTDGRGQVSHVGIYLGDDTFVNANTFQGRVVVDRLLGDRYWSARYVGARRVLPAPLGVARP